MVDKKEIEKIFDDVLINFKSKCFTIAQMKEKLKDISLNEQFTKLKEENLINPLEVEDYDNILNKIHVQEVYRKYDEEHYNPNNQWAKPMFDKDKYDEYHDELFQYGRRLIEGLKNKPIPVIDKSDFKTDNQFDRKTNEIRTLMGEVESKQVETQASVFANGDTRVDLGITVLEMDERKKSMNNYFNGDIQNLVDNINSEKYINKLNNAQRKDIKNIDSLMKESSGLVEDVILYRGGHWDIHLKPGDHSKFRAYTSTSFQQSIANSFVENHSGGMNFIIHARKGTKGITGNDRVNFHNGFAEHEYVLPRNTGYTVLSVDYDTMTAEILLDSE